MVKQIFDKTVEGISEAFPGIFAPTPKAPDSRKASCEAQGGKWDEVNQRCVFPPRREETPQVQEEPQPEFDVTGRPTSIPRGVPLTREQSQELQEAAEFEASKGGQPSAMEAITMQQQQLQRQQEAQVLAEQAGQVNLEQLQRNAETADVSYVEAFFKAVPNMIPDIIQVIGGAAVATVAGGTGIGAVGGVALIGNGIRGAYSDVIREIEQQKGEFSGTQEQNLEEGKQVLNDIISARNAGAVPNYEASTAWNNQVTKLYQSYYNLQRQHLDNKFVGDDLTQEIAEFETFFTGEFLQQENEFGLALTQPSPDRIVVTPQMRERILKKLKQEGKLQ